MSAPRLLELLPAIHREDPYLGEFLSAFEAVLLGLDDPPISLRAGDAVQPAALEAQIDQLALTFSADRTPVEFLPWLAGWVALTLRSDLSEGEQRAFLRTAAQRYRSRGTAKNLYELLKLFTAGEPKVREDDPRPFRFAVDFGLQPQSRFGGDIQDYPAYVDRQSDRAYQVIELEKPAHTDFDLNPLFPTLRISPPSSDPADPNARTPGYFSTVGVDTLLGAEMLDPVPPTVKIAATPAKIALGQSTTLRWSSANSGGCSASGGWSGPMGADGTMVVTPSAQGTASYTLTVIGDVDPSDTATATATVEVGPPPPTVRIDASPKTVVVGKPVTITWSTSDATGTGTASGGWTGSRPGSGSEVVTPMATGTAKYALAFTGPGGSTSASVSIAVSPLPAPPDVTLTATPATVEIGRPVTLLWTSARADSTVASGAWSGAKAANGSETVTVTPSAAGTVSFVLTCANDGGSKAATAAVTVTAPKPAVTLTASSTSTFTGMATTLTWQSTNATSATSTGGPTGSGWPGSRPVNGTWTFTPSATGKLTFALSATGPGGTTTASVMIMVAAGDGTHGSSM